MGLARMHAGGESVEPADPMREPLLDEEVERTIGHGRLVSETLLRQPLQHLVGAERPVFFEEDLERAPAHRRQASPGRGRGLLGMGEDRGRTTAVIVRRECRGASGIGGHPLPH